MKKSNKINIILKISFILVFIGIAIEAIAAIIDAPLWIAFIGTGIALINIGFLLIYTICELINDLRKIDEDEK